MKRRNDFLSPGGGYPRKVWDAKRISGYGTEGVAYNGFVSAGAPSPFAEFDSAFGFALVFGQSFVGGTDTAINNDPNKNILVGFHLE